MRVRAWVIGVALIAGGFIYHIAFAVWGGYGGRIEMGQFACVEALLFAVGLGLWAASLSAQPPTTSLRQRSAGCLLWVAVAFAAAVAVLWRLPP